uniref:PPUP157 n=1 Tax=Poeciliopsis prolifica TaxID=188132 RepID=A0A0S7ENH6_9TELE
MGGGWSSSLESQDKRSTFPTQSNPVPSILLSGLSNNKGGNICWQSVQLSASVVSQPDAPWAEWTILPNNQYSSQTLYPRKEEQHCKFSHKQEREEAAELLLLSALRLEISKFG